MPNLGREFLLPLLIFAIPILAIVGGIVAGITRAIGRQRALELMYRERLAAIEHGLDPSKIPPPALSDEAAKYEFLSGLDWSDSPERRAQGLMIAGIITLSAGIGIGLFLLVMRADGTRPLWAMGLVPAIVGIGLLVSAWLVRPRNGGSAGAPPRGA